MRKLLLLIPLVLCMGCKGTPPNKDAITEISLARTPCFGTCPVDTLTLRRMERRNMSGKCTSRESVTSTDRSTPNTSRDCRGS